MRKKIIYAIFVTLMLSFGMLVSSVSSEEENDEVTIPLFVGHNLISIPCDMIVEKTDLITRYNDIDYSFADATSSNNPTGRLLISSRIFGWDKDAQSHILADELEPGQGYWISSLCECELVIQGDLSADSYFTDLKEGHNLVGLPYDEPVDVTDLIVGYQGVDYTWDEATTSNNPTGNPLVNSLAIWGFDTVNNNYYAADILEPGKGYWMFSYQDDVSLSMDDGEPEDTVDPVTNIEFNCELGNNGWYISDVEVVLTAEDEGSGVDTTYYSIDRGPFMEYEEPFVIETDGVHVISYYSVDNAGNEETIEQEHLKIDTEPSTSFVRLVGKSPRESRNTFYSAVKIIINAKDITSGVECVCYQLDENGGVCYPGSEISFMVTEKGDHVLEFYSVDKAGNIEEMNTISFSIVPIFGR